MKINMIRPKLLLLAVFSVVAVITSIPAQADGAGAFLGGVAVARIGQNARDRRDYEEDQAYYAQQQAQAAQAQAAQASAQPSAEEQLAQLQDLAQKGYITPEEYKAKKKAILDSM